MNRHQETSKSIGPPMQLRSAILLLSLDQDRLYTPAMIAAKGADSKQAQADYQRLRNNFKRFANYHNIKTEADGRVGAYKAWYGQTWQENLREADYLRARLALSLLDVLRHRLDECRRIGNGIPVSLEGETGCRPVIGRNRKVAWGMVAAAILSIAVFMTWEGKQVSLKVPSKPPTQNTESVDPNQKMEQSLMEFKKKAMAQRMVLHPFPDRTNFANRPKPLHDIDGKAEMRLFAFTISHPSLRTPANELEDPP